jgi:hypothetical protein
MEVSKTARNFTILIKNGDSGVDPREFGFQTGILVS